MSKSQEFNAPLSGDKDRRSLDALASWFEAKKRVLPWRDEPSLYRVWVSEIMLQQTQVVTVKPYFERFVARFPTVEALASAPTEDVLALWAGLGYYSRARNLHRAAQRIVRDGFPTDRDGWLEIPGVGDYTAGAILSIALDQPEAILDGNVERVLSRIKRVNREDGDAAYKERLWALSREWVEEAHRRMIRPSVLNQALMELGATVCTPRKPLCDLCPVSAICQARARGDIEAYPPRKKPKQWVDVREEMHCVLDDQGRVLLCQRAAGEWRAGLWDLPTQIQGAESRKFGFERLGLVETKHIVTRHKILRTTHVWLRKTSARLTATEPSAAVASGKGELSQIELRWVRIDEPEVAVGSALKKTLQAVRERYREAL